MAEFTLGIKPAFLSDQLNLNKDLLKRVVNATEELVIAPDVPRGDTIKKLQYHDKLWRYRIGDYRLVYAVYKPQKLVQLLGIGPRGEVYERMGYKPDAPDYQDYSQIFESALNPNEETPADWLQYANPRPVEDTSRTLPYKLTSERLTAWRIPAEFHGTLTNCETEDQLQNCGVPDNYIFHLIECMWPANAAEIVQQPNLLVDKPDDLLRYADGDLIGFLLLLDGDQERMVDWALRGPTLVKGGPGSGKSTVALYRVRALIEHFAEQHQVPRVLFTTYTNSLVEFSRQLLGNLLGNIPGSSYDLEVSTVDRIAMQIVTNSNGKPDMATEQDLIYALTVARSAFTPQTTNPLEIILIRNAIASLRDDYLIDEFEWVIEGRGIKTLGEYQETDRSGRGYAFDARLRTAVWNLYQNALSFLASVNKLTWGGLRNQALEIIHSGMAIDKWDCVIIDEAQDLTPIALALCIELCQDPSGIFLTADASQSLYNRGFAWKNVHETLRVTGRTRILKRNYRTTRQIALAALSIMQNTQAGDQEAMQQQYVHVGPLPKIYTAIDETDQYLWLASQLINATRELHLPFGAIAILTPHNHLAKDAANQLSQHGLPTQYMQGKRLDLESPLAKSLTIHSCKGLEFPIVAIPNMEEGVLPQLPSDERAEDWDKQMDQERRLFYVACTRAMRRLYVTYRTGRRSSFLLNLESGLWEENSFSG